MNLIDTLGMIDETPTVEDLEKYAKALEEALEVKDNLIQEARQAVRELLGLYSENNLIRRGYEKKFRWVKEEDQGVEDEENRTEGSNG